MSSVMKLSEMCKKLQYQKQVNTGYSEGFLGRIDHKPITAYATTKQSRYDSGVAGLDLNFDDFQDTDDIINDIKDEVFRNVSVIFNNQELVTAEIKTNFLNRYWNMKLGQPTQQQFLMSLRQYFRVDCKNLLIQNYLLSTVSIADLIDGGSQSHSSSATTHNGSASKPNDEVLYYETAKDTLMTRADIYAKGVSSADSIGNNTLGKYQAFINTERLTNLDVILTNARILFLLTMN